MMILLPINQHFRIKIFPFRKIKIRSEEKEMKKWLFIILIGIFLLIIFFPGYFTDYSQSKEFEALYETLDDKFFPLVDCISDHLSKSEEKMNQLQFTTFYLLEGGMEENLEMQQKIVELKSELMNFNVQYPDTIALKENVIQQLNVLKKLLEKMYNAPPNLDVMNFQMFQNEYEKDIEIQSQLLEKMDYILEKNYE